MTSTLTFLQPILNQTGCPRCIGEFGHPALPRSSSAVAYAVLWYSPFMQSEQGLPDSTVRFVCSSDELQAIRALALRVAAEATLMCAADLLSRSLSRLVNAPLALLS